MYGDVKENVGSSLTGEVEGYALNHFELNEGGSLDIHFKKVTSNGKEITLRGRIYPVDPEKITPYENQTQEEAVQKARERKSRTIKNIVRNYVSDDEYGKVMKSRGVNSFETLVEAAKSCLPPDFNTRKGRLVVGFNKKGYLAFPDSLQWDSKLKRFLPFFTLDPEQKLMPLPKDLTLDKVIQEEVVESSDDLPF